MARELYADETLPDLEHIAHLAAREFGRVFNEQILAIENLAALRALAKAPEPAPQFPAQDTPLQVPPEVERLHNPKNRPVDA